MWYVVNWGATKHIWATVILLVLTSSVEARELPSEVDLRAAYCIPYLQEFINAARLPPMLVDSPEAQQAAEELLSDLTSDLRRLQLYLVPRLRYLDPLGIAAARKKGEEDLVKLHKYSETCRTKCQHFLNKPSQESCFKTCHADAPVNIRFKVCGDLSWLPF